VFNTHSYKEQGLVLAQKKNKNQEITLGNRHILAEMLGACSGAAGASEHRMPLPGGCPL
jgi:hypothetical protein